jgi:hypothetical protein
LTDARYAIFTGAFFAAGSSLLALLKQAQKHFAQQGSV